MAEKETNPSLATDLRRQAEAIALENIAQSPENLEAMSPEAIRQTLHELRVHQIELTMQNKELRQTQEKLEVSKARYFDLYDMAPVGYCTLSEIGLILEANFIVATLLSVTRQKLVKQPFSRFVMKDDQDMFYLHSKQTFKADTPQVCELRMVKKDGATFWAHLAMTTAQDENGTPLCRVALSDITEHKLQEDEREFTARLIALVNTPGDFRARMSDLTASLRVWSGCEAVGIRLRAGADYPYYETRGFPPTFVEAENHFCAYGPEGEILRDHTGNPVMECMCGNILCGRFDPAQPFFTSHGSFWSNSTTALLANTTEADRQARTRNRCNGEGYESVALIPLRVGQQVFGLLQFNDHRPNRFTSGLITHFERMADSLAIALSRRQAEKALQESEKKTREILESITDAFFSLDDNMVVKYFNPVAERMLNRKAAEVIGRGLFDAFPEARGSVFEKNYAQCIRTKTALFFEVGFAVAPYENWYDVRVYPEKNGIAVFFQVITERKQAEEALRESEEKHKRMITNISDVIAIMDKGGTLKYKSPNIAKWFGWQPEDLVGTDGWEMVHPEDIERIQKDFFTLLDKDNSVTTVEYRYKCKDGSYKLIELTAVNLTNDPLINGVLMNYRDITERKQAEKAIRQGKQRLELSLRSARAGTWDWDMTSGQLDWSMELYTLFGLHPDGAQATFDTWEKVIHPDDKENAYNRINNAIQEKIPLYSEYRVIMPDGQVRWISALGDTTYDDSGKPVRMIGICTDITERKRAEEERQSLQERLQRAEKMEALGLLAGGVAHDLNNVLGIVVGYAELILENVYASNSIKPHLVNIMNGGQKAAAIVDDLLTLARRGVSGKEVLNLNEIIADCQQSPEFEKLSSYHPAVKISTDLESDLPNITCSSIHLGKSLYNLVSNACEAMPKGGIVTIKTSSQYLEQPLQGYDEIRSGDYAVLSVSDTGEGIPANDIRRIFEPFYTKKVMGRSGTGLGLAVVWGTVKDHNGYINVQSEKGKGSIFTVYFPVTREEITAEGVPASLSEYMGKGESILVVDDVKEQRDLAAGMLTTLNYNVSSVSSGEEAVAYLKEHQADLMLLDMIMDPGMDGLDTYRNILEIHPKQKAIIVSGFSESDRVHAAQGLGAGAYVKKPYIKEKLGLAVRKELDQL